MEHMVIEFVKLLDPVFGWSAKSQNPEQFLLLTDTILELPDLLDTSHLPPEHQQRVLRARQLRVQMRAGLGRRSLFHRSLPLDLTAGRQLNIAELEAMVRCRAACPKFDLFLVCSMSSNVPQLVILNTTARGCAGLRSSMRTVDTRGATARASNARQRARCVRQRG
jgi:hypothetical protein